MLVRELIEELQEYDGSLEVFRYHKYEGFYDDVDYISSVGSDDTGCPIIK